MHLQLFLKLLNQIPVIYKPMVLNQPSLISLLYYPFLKSYFIDNSTHSILFLYIYYCFTLPIFSFHSYLIFFLFQKFFFFLFRSFISYRFYFSQSFLSSCALQKLFLFKFRNIPPFLNDFIN